MVWPVPRRTAAVTPPFSSAAFDRICLVSRSLPIAWGRPSAEAAMAVSDIHAVKTMFLILL